MRKSDWREDTSEKEEELCRALSNFPITLNEFSMLIKPPKLQVPSEKFHEDQPLPDDDPIPDHPTYPVTLSEFSMKKQLIKPPKLQVTSEKFHGDQPLPDDDPIPDHPNQLKEVVLEETVRNNSDVLALLVIGEKNWALKQKKFPWLWKGQDESAEEKQKEEKEKKIPWSSFPLEQEPLHSSDTDDEETEGSSDEKSDDSGFDEDMEENEEAAGKREKVSLDPFLGLALGSALLGGSLGYCRARMGGWLSGVMTKKVVKGSALAIASIPSEPSIVAGILGVGLFTWGAVNLGKESSCYKKAVEE